MPRKAKVEQEKPATEETVNEIEPTKKEETAPAPAKFVKCKSKTYSEDVLAKKREMALKALAVARKNREERMKAQVEEEVKLKELQAKKEAKTIPKAEPKPEPKPEPEEEVELEVKPIPKPAKVKKPKQPVYQDSSESDESDDEEYVLTKKKTVKKLKALKADHKNRHNYEVSEQALLKKWAEERYKMAMNSLFPTHGF